MSWAFSDACLNQNYARFLKIDCYELWSETTGASETKISSVLSQRKSKIICIPVEVPISGMKYCEESKIELSLWKTL